jgi:hypothetical protein
VVEDLEIGLGHSELIVELCNYLRRESLRISIVFSKARLDGEENLIGVEETMC